MTLSAYKLYSYTLYTPAHTPTHTHILSPVPHSSTAAKDNEAALMCCRRRLGNGANVATRS